MIIRMVVVLPAPLGPMTPYNAPCGTTRSMPSTATVDPKVFLNRLSSSAGTIGLAWDQQCRPGLAFLDPAAHASIQHHRLKIATVDEMRPLWVPLAVLIGFSACDRASDP